MSGISDVLYGLRSVSAWQDRGRTDDIYIRFAGAAARLVNALMVAVSIVAIARTVPRNGSTVGR